MFPALFIVKANQEPINFPENKPSKKAFLTKGLLSEFYGILTPIGHFTVVCLVTWPLSGSEAGSDLVLIQTLLLFTCKSCSHAN